MKVRVLKTPTMQYGGNLYDNYRFSPGEVNSLGVMGARFGEGIAKMFGDITYVSGKPTVTPYNTDKSRSNIFKRDTWKPVDTQNIHGNYVAPYNEYYGAGNIPNATKNLKPGDTMLFRPTLNPSDTAPVTTPVTNATTAGGKYRKYNQYITNPFEKGLINNLANATDAADESGQQYDQFGNPIKADGGFISQQDQQGEQRAVDPQLLQAYRTIGSALGGGQDPNELVQQFVDQGISMEDAKDIVRKVMDYMQPLSAESLPTAQMGGTQTGMNAGMFAGQSIGSNMFGQEEKPNIIPKPLMKDGGHTFVTSQPAYTKKSVTYFGTSNAPARDSYTDNDPVTTSVKAVPREEATIEAEKGEYIFSDKGLYKILGKKHYEGGTPLAAKGGEFIYSDHKDMSLDPKLQKEAGLKVHSSKALAEHTPAKVLERNVDVKEYNRLKSILENPKSDAITKKTAQFVLDKMNSRLEVISKLQEAKKQPAPTEIQNQYLEQSETEKDINEQRQYAYGGDTLPKYKNEGDVEYVRDPATGELMVATRSTVSGLSDKSQLNYPYSTRDNAKSAPERRKRLEEWYDAMVAAGYKGTNPLAPGKYDPAQPGTEFDAIGELQEWTARTYPEYVKQYLLQVNPSQKVKDYLKLKGVNKLSDVKDFSPEDAAKLFRDNKFDFRLPLVFNKAKIEYKPWERPKDKAKDVIETKKPYSEMVSDINIPDPYEQVKAMQFSQYANNVLSNKPYFTYTPAINQPWTIAPKQSTQPLENQAGIARTMGARVASRLQDSSAMQQALAKQNEAVNDAFFKVGEWNANKEAENYNNNLLRNSAAVNQFNQNLKQTHDLNSNVLDKMNYANAAYYNQYSAARQKDMLNRYYTSRDLLTSELPYADTYDVENPNGSISRHMTVPINPLTGQFNTNWKGWDSKAVNDLANQESREDREEKLKKYRQSGYSPQEIMYIEKGNIR